MALQVYNSLTRQKELFVPLHEGLVMMYICGPTVYADAHIGHGKTYVNFDIIVRYLRYLGYRVRYVQNITDVGHLLDSGEDRILRGAEREHIQPMELVERYTKEQQLFVAPGSPRPSYTKVLPLDLGTIEPSLAGPKRPQDRVPLSAVKRSFGQALRAPVSQRGFGLSKEEADRTATVAGAGGATAIGHGAVVIAAITSCTNTSNPSVMLAAGLLAKKAVQKGLRVKPHVKTSLAPGSRVVKTFKPRVRSQAASN